MELPPDCLLWRHSECVVEGAVRKADGQIGLKNEDRFADRLYQIQRVDVVHRGRSRMLPLTGPILDGRKMDTGRACVALPSVWIASS